MTVRDEHGQVLALTLLMLGALLGMAALVIDVGAWFYADRKLQATVDTAAAAGAQALPEDPAGAVALAIEYAEKNGGGVAPQGVAVGATSNDTITVRGTRDVPGFFSRVFGIFSVEVEARAVARASTLMRARKAAPIVAHEDHPLLQCAPEPCYDQQTELTLANLNDPGSSNAAGAFGLVNYMGDAGTVAPSVIADWLRDGYDAEVEPGQFRAATGAKFNSTDVRDALADVVGRELLLPVYRAVVGTGQTASFEIVGWVGFVVSGWEGSGSSGTLRGEFRRLTWDGEPAPAAATGVPYFGAKAVALVG